MGCGKVVTKKDVDKIKLLLSRGLDDNEIETITGWGRMTTSRVRNGHFDEKFADKPKSENEILKDLMQKNLEILIKIDDFISKGAIK